MSGVIVVDAESFRSTCFGCDAYIHDHFLDITHNYAEFCQLHNSNLFTYRRILMLLRDATSKSYGPWVSLSSYQSLSLYYCFAFTLLLIFTLHLYTKNTKNIIYHLYQISLS